MQTISEVSKAWNDYAKEKNKMAMNDIRSIRNKDELVKYREIVRDLSNPKSVKENALRQVRRLEKILGYPSLPYNGG